MARPQKRVRSPDSEGDEQADDSVAWNTASSETKSFTKDYYDVNGTATTADQLTAADTDATLMRTDTKKKKLGAGSVTIDPADLDRPGHARRRLASGAAGDHELQARDRASSRSPGRQQRGRVLARVQRPDEQQVRFGQPPALHHAVSRALPRAENGVGRLRDHPEPLAAREP